MLVKVDLNTWIDTYAVVSVRIAKLWFVGPIVLVRTRDNRVLIVRPDKGMTPHACMDRVASMANEARHGAR